jgi:hypothetical protein
LEEKRSLYPANCCCLQAADGLKPVLPLPLPRSFPVERQVILRRKQSIRYSFAFFLLFVFALSATPKVVFHEALAAHRDGLVCQDRDKSETHLHQPAFHCCFDDLVVSSPYISFDLNAVASPLCYYFTPGESSVTYIFSSFFLHQEDRGPPQT